MNADPQARVFIDTNILVYAYDRSAGEKHSVAARLLEQCWEAETGCLSIQVLQEFFVVVTRKLAHPLDPRTARLIIADLARWRVHSPNAGDLLYAIDLHQERSLSFWDAMVMRSATCLGCEQLFSEDFQHGESYGSVKVTNPFFNL
jgi:predicted nucleic acid-binding protein